MRLPHREGACESDRGETLLELLVAITVLAVCVVSFGTSIALAVQTSNRHRQQSDAAAYLRSYAELVDSYVASDSSHYPGCIPANTFTAGTVGLTLPAEYTASHTAGLSMSATGVTSACTSANEDGAQQLTLSISSANATESLVVVVRKP